MYNYNFDLSPYDDWAKEEMENIYIEKEMQEYRQRALDKFSSIVPHPDFTVRVAVSICYGYRDSIAESEDIIKKLDLDDMEICAIEGNFDTFKELYIEHKEQDSISYYDEYCEGVI